MLRATSGHARADSPALYSAQVRRPVQSRARCSGTNTRSCAATCIGTISCRSNSRCQPFSQHKYLAALRLSGGGASQLHRRHSAHPPPRSTGACGCLGGCSGDSGHTERSEAGQASRWHSSSASESSSGTQACLPCSVLAQCAESTACIVTHKHFPALTVAVTLAEGRPVSGLLAAASQHDAVLLAALLAVCVGVAAVLLPHAWAEAAEAAAGDASGQQSARGGASESASASLLRFLLVRSPGFSDHAHSSHVADKPSSSPCGGNNSGSHSCCYPCSLGNCKIHNACKLQEDTQSLGGSALALNAACMTHTHVAMCARHSQP